MMSKCEKVMMLERLKTIIVAASAHHPMTLSRYHIQPIHRERPARPIASSVPGNPETIVPKNGITRLAGGLHMAAAVKEHKDARNHHHQYAHEDELDHYHHRQHTRRQCLSI